MRFKAPCCFSESPVCHAGTAYSTSGRIKPMYYGFQIFNRKTERLNVVNMNKRPLARLMISEIRTSYLRSFDIVTPKILIISVVCSSLPESHSVPNKQGSRMNETSMFTHFFRFEIHFVHVGLFMEILEVFLNSRCLIAKGILNYGQIMRIFEHHLILFISKSRDIGFVLQM